MEGTKDNKKKLIILGSVIGVVIILLIATIVVLGTNSKSPYIVYFDKATKLIDEVFDKSEKITLDDKKLGMNGKIKVNLDLNDDLLNDDIKKIQEAVNKTEFSYDIKMDQEEKLIQLFLSALKDNEELINLDVVAIDDKGYVKIKDVLDKYYKVDLDEAVEFNIDTEELEMLDEMEVLYNIAKKDVRKILLAKENISTSKDEIKIDGEEVSVKKHTLIITQEVAGNTAIAILEDILDSDEAMDALLKLVNMNSYGEYDIDDLEEELEDEIENINNRIEEVKEDEENTSVGIVNIYTKKNKILKVELGELEQDEVEITFAVEINEIEKDKYECVVFAYEEKVLKIAFEKKDKDVYSIEINSYEDDSKIAIDGTIKEDKIDIEYSVKINGETAKGIVFIESEKDKKFTYKFSIEMKEFGKAAVEVEMNIDNEFEIPDVSDATTEINQEEVQEKLMNKLQDIAEKFGIDLNELMGLNYMNNIPDYDYNDYDWNDDYDYNYDYDDTDWSELFKTME